MHGLTALFEAVQNQQPVSGLTHNFYRYPARFAPSFAREAILHFTQPGDLVYDPFMGGGTSLVEARALGRRAAGTDISSLAVFLTQAKTTTLTRRQILNLGRWGRNVVPKMNIRAHSRRPKDWIETGYQRNISDPATWRVRKLLEVGVEQTQALKSPAEKGVARCALLRTGQWALDCRQEIPSAAEFRIQFLDFLNEMLAGATEFAKEVSRSKAVPDPLCLHRSAIGAENDPAFQKIGAPALVLTSPPYPGLHVLYHRWQVMGRRETPAPFWIAGTLDGAGASFYTFGDRHQKELRGYYAQAGQAFTSLAKIVQSSTVIAQLVAFGEPCWQLPAYLEMMENAGFKERFLREIANSDDGRVWRGVPNRKWYADHNGQTGGSREVLLIHQLR